MTRPDSEHGDKHEPPRRSASAEAAALRFEESQPVDPQAPPPPAVDEPPVRRRPGGHSASADAAALRWQEQHPDDED